MFFSVRVGIFSPTTSSFQKIDKKIEFKKKEKPYRRFPNMTKSLASETECYG